MEDKLCAYLLQEIGSHTVLLGECVVRIGCYKDEFQ